MQFSISHVLSVKNNTGYHFDNSSVCRKAVRMVRSFPAIPCPYQFGLALRGLPRVPPLGLPKTPVTVALRATKPIRRLSQFTAVTFENRPSSLIT